MVKSRMLSLKSKTEIRHIITWGTLYLVFIGPEGADSQLHLMPLLGMRPRCVPHWNTKRAAVNSHIHPQCPWTVAITTVQEVAKLDAVRVIFTQRLQQQLCTVARGMLGGVHQHIGSWKEQRKCIR